MSACWPSATISAASPTASDVAKPAETVAAKTEAGSLQAEQAEVSLNSAESGGAANAAENAGGDTVQEAYKALGIETSSASTAPSRLYAIYQQDGKLFKFGVTDANFVRMNQSLKMAGPGSYARHTDVMSKYQAHLGENT